MAYQLSTTTPYEGGPIVDLGGLALIEGGVLAVFQAQRASLRWQTWAQPAADHPSVTSSGVGDLGAGAKSSVIASAQQDVAVAYQRPGANAGNLMGWLAVNKSSFVPAQSAEPSGSRPSISRFASSVEAPPRAGGVPKGNRNGDVTIGAVGTRVVTAYNHASNADVMRLTIWNVPYQTNSSLDAPLAYQTLTTSPARRPSVVGLREALDGVWLRSADVLVASATDSDRLLLRRYVFDTAAPAAINLVASANTEDAVGEIATVVMPLRTGMVVVTAVATLAKQLKMIAWKVGEEGAPVLWFEQVAGSAERVQIVRLRDRDFAIGSVEAAGTASLRYWRLPEAGAAAPACTPLATFGKVEGAKALRLAYRPGPGAHSGTTFMAVQRQDDSFILRGIKVTEN